MKENSKQDVKNLPRILWIAAQTALIAICVQGIIFGGLLLASRFLS